MVRSAYIALVSVLMLCTVGEAASFSLWGTSSDSKAAVTVKTVSADVVANDQKAVKNNVADEAIIKLLAKIDSLQQEVQDLRGLLELQGHELAKLERKQIDLYSDLDHRMVSCISGTNYQLNNANQPILTTPSVVELNVVKEVKEEFVASADHNIALEQEKKLYKQAYDLLQENKYEESENLLQKIIVNFPSGNYAPNAYYWLGEIYLNSGTVQEAQLSFSQIVEEFPRHEKAAESLLKLGTIEYSIGNQQQATRIFKEVTLRYPGTPAARLAVLQLRKL